MQNGIGVPGVAEILDIIRDEIAGRAAFSLPAFETALGGKTGGDAYQEAMKWLGKRMGQDAINDVIRTAILKARKTGAADLGQGSDGQPEEWHIPTGTADLGTMVAGENDRFLGPVLTTNFDPLISLAIRGAGGRSGRRVLTADGTLAGAAEDVAGICSVVHLHGFWRDSDTLHTQAQLTNPRPKLTKSLQRLLQSRTLIVAAYGGWNDVFTQTLAELMNDEHAPLDVIWCFYESDADTVKERYRKLIDAVEPAIVMNRFRAFGGIDCHSVFGEILSTLRGMAAPVKAHLTSSPVAGWERIDAAYLGALSPLSHTEVIRYFDGATPTWRHAMCANIPSRAAVAEVGRRLQQARNTKTNCSLQLIRAAGGEGKTTLLLQAAAEAAKSGDWNVLWRPTSRLGLPPEHISSLTPDKSWLIVADDAENLVSDLSEIARQLHESGSSHVHFLLAARDTDWRHCQGDQRAWNTWLAKNPDILLRDLPADDGRKLVEAWQKFGDDGLRDLASLSGTEEQAAALLDAVRDVSSRDEGSFFGGLLAVRFGPDGLRSHVIALLHRLKDAKVRDSDHTLFDALLYVAACHAAGIPGIDEKVLADLLRVERDWVQTRVVKPLGEEAAAVRSAGHVFTRHRSVAAAILVAAEQDFGADIAEVWSAIVRQTVKTAQDGGVSYQTHSKIIHAGPRLQRALPPQFSEQRRKEIAVAAARADIAAEPDRLSALVGLGKTYRNADDYPAAIRVFRENLSLLHGKVDYDSQVRGYWYEWSLAEGMRCVDHDKALADGWLGLISLSDFLKTAPITADNVRLICAGLGIAFGKLASHAPGCPYANARRAAVFLGRLTTSDAKTLSYFDKHDHDADKINTPHPANVEEAIGWLTAAVAQAACGLQDPFLRELAKPERVSFNLLREFFRHVASPRRGSKRAARSAAPKAPSTSSGKGVLQKMHVELEQKKDAGIERTLKETWALVPEHITGEERFGIAKTMAGDVIARLSPSIRKKVKDYFNSTDWERLKVSDPKA